MKKPETRTCKKCGLTKPLEDFGTSPRSKYGRRYTCKRCAMDRQTELRHRDNDKWQKYLDKEAERKRVKRSNPEYNKNQTLVRDFGITLDEYKKMLLEQNGVCAICGNPETATYKGRLTHLCVDHNHKTLHLRGLLCADCNRGLGMFWEDIDVLEKAIKYLRYWEKNGTRKVTYKSQSSTAKAKKRNGKKLK